ncbi:MAG TPA: Maf family protein [bacterium]|nr:Maf family protein [bacterium]
MIPSFYLASTSPRRKDLLSRLKIPFVVVAPPFEETPTSLPPRDECLLFAEGKAKSAGEVLRKTVGEGWVLAADTLISCEGEILGKPRDAEDAFRILKRLAGRTHEVHTAVALLDLKTQRIRRHDVETARVTFRPMSEGEIRAYVDTGEPLGKAGAYAVQGAARRLFIENIEGDEEAVIGLPVALVAKWLKEVGLI